MHAQINSAQARSLAAFVATMRPGTPTAPGWDVPGIAAALHAARHRAPVDELAIALIRLAGRHDLRTPAVLAEDGPHWRGLDEAAKTIRPADQKRCDVYGHERSLIPCRLCEADAKARPDDAPPVGLAAPDPDQQDINARGARRVRAALNPRHQPTTTEGDAR